MFQRVKGWIQHYNDNDNICKLDDNIKRVINVFDILAEKCGKEMHTFHHW